MKGVKYGLSIFIGYCIVWIFSCNSDISKREDIDVPNFRYQVYFTQSKITMCGDLLLDKEEIETMKNVCKEIYGSYNPKGNYVFVIDAEAFYKVKCFKDFVAALRRKLIE